MDSEKAASITFPDPDIAARYLGRELLAEEIMELLPHRPPFLLVDKILEVVPGERAVGVKAVSMGEPYFAGHFPGHPVMPGVLILESLAQVAGVALLTGLSNRNLLAYFTGIKDAKFRRPVRPGDLVRVDASVDRLSIRFGRIVARMNMLATVNGDTVAEAVCSFLVFDPSEDKKT